MSDKSSNSPRDAAIAVLAKATKLLDKKSTAIEDIKVEDMKKSAEFTSGLHHVAYYGLETSKHSAQQAALAVLAKSQDMMSETVSVPSEGMQKSAEADSGMHKVEYYKSEPLAKKYEGFKAVEESARKSGASDPGAVAAAVGRKKYGKHAFQEAAAHGHKMGKGENPDEKQDAQLGEDVEHLCEDHMSANKSAERKEGHKLVSKAECAQCVGGMQKSEFADLYADLEEMAKSEGQGAGNKKAPSNDMKPKIEEKPIERDYQDFETKPGHAPENDHREAPQAAPQSNPKEQHEGNNPPAGAIPADKTATGATPGTGKKGVHKLSFFMGHQHSKKGMKKGIALG